MMKDALLLNKKSSKSSGKSDGDEDGEGNGNGKKHEDGDGGNGKADGVVSSGGGSDRKSERREFIARCYDTADLSRSRTSRLVQHPVPIHPPGSTAASRAPVQPVLHLTKREMKRQRKLRRAERSRELQDLQAAGLAPPPEPRLTLGNFMRVLGDQAVLDPSEMERRVTEQIKSRKLKHERTNAERKLTKEQRSAKRTRKLHEDTSESVSVALFLVRNMGHRYHRTKVDLNAQQNGITGGVLECSEPQLALVVAEGGPKAVKRYMRLMTVRMNWTGENFGDDDDWLSDDEEMGEGVGRDGTAAMGSSGATNSEGGDDVDKTKPHRPQRFDSANHCELVWTGMAPRRSFQSFAFQRAESAPDARKVLEARGAAHFWDRAVEHAASWDSSGARGVPSLGEVLRCHSGWAEMWTMGKKKKKARGYRDWDAVRLLCLSA